MSKTAFKCTFGDIGKLKEEQMIKTEDEYWNERFNEEQHHMAIYCRKGEHL